MFARSLQCPNCLQEYPLSIMVLGCPACRTEKYVANVEVTYDFDRIAASLSKDSLARRPATLWRYAELLPVSDPAHVVSLGEGMTPLIPLPRLGQQLGVPHLYLKNETLNPTWSFKDRLCSVAVSMAQQFGSRGIVASSTGNHGASAAAYAARAGLPCIVLTLARAPETMKVLMQAYGALVVAVTASTDRWKLMTELVERFGWYPVTNFTSPSVGSNPYGVEGHKTIGYEIAEQLDWQTPDWVVMPTSYADGLAGIWKGFSELHRLGWVARQPRLLAAEVYGPLANALTKSLEYVEPVRADTETAAISIGGTVSTTQGLRALRASGGSAVAVEESRTLEMQLKLAATEGIYLEVSSAVGLAAIEKSVAAGDLDPAQTVVLVGTSSGLKDPEPTKRHLPDVPVISPSLDSLKSALKQVYDYDLPSEPIG